MLIAVLAKPESGKKFLAILSKVTRITPYIPYLKEGVLRRR